EPPDGRTVADGEIVAGRAAAVTELSEDHCGAANSTGPRNEGRRRLRRARRGVQRRPAVSPRPPEHRVLDQDRPRKQVEARAQHPGRCAVAERWTPAIAELGMVGRAANVKVEAGSTDVLDDELAVVPPGAAGQELPPAGREGSA